jgi:hypothetical protein
MGRAESAILLEIADRLVAPRLWVEDMARQFGTSRSALTQAAQSIGIPWTSMRAVLHARPLREADAVHRQLRETTGYPWFLPAHLRDRYPKDRW